MCMGDWRIGRMVRSVLHEQVTDAGGNVVIPANPQRVGITIFTFETANVTFLTGIDNVTTNATTLVNGSNVQFHATLVTHGDLPSRKLTLNPNSGQPDILVWIEYLMTERALSKATEWLQREGFL